MTTDEAIEYVREKTQISEGWIAISYEERKLVELCIEFAEQLPSESQVQKNSLGTATECLPPLSKAANRREPTRSLPLASSAQADDHVLPHEVTDSERLQCCLKYGFAKILGTGSEDFDFIPLTLELIDKQIQKTKSCGKTL